MREREDNGTEAADASQSGGHDEAVGEVLDDTPAAGAPDPEGVEGTVVAESKDEVIANLRAELEQLEDRHLRIVAEFDNFRKRTARERALQAERAQAELAKGLLDSLDDLARVSAHGSIEHDAAALLEGVQLVEAKLMRALEQAGLKRVEAVGKPFDPEVHEALLAVPTSDPEQDHIVSQEFTRGYLFKDTLLRPSLVEVKQYQPDSAAEAEEATEQGDEV